MTGHFPLIQRVKFHESLLYSYVQTLFHFSSDLIICIFVRKTLNNGRVKTPKVRNDDKKHEEKPLHKLRDNKQTKRQKLLRGGKSSPSQQRLLACVPQGNVTEENRMRRHFGDEAADHKVPGSDCREQNLKGRNVDQEIERGKSNNVDRRWLSENAPRRNSFDDSLITRRRKSESDIEINTESSDHNLLEEEAFKRNDKRQREKDKYMTDKKTDCEACQRLLNGGDKDNKVVCTAL